MIANAVDLHRQQRQGRRIIRATEPLAQQRSRQQACNLRQEARQVHMPKAKITLLCIVAAVAYGIRGGRTRFASRHAADTLDRQHVIAMSTTTHPTATPKPRLRWLQFSLRGLMVLMLLLGCGFGWLAHKLKQAKEQREAVKALRQLGGGAMQCPNYEPRRDRNSRVQSWLQETLGEDFFETINYAELGGSKVTDDDLGLLGALPRLAMLRLDGTQVTDTGAIHLRPLGQLQELYLGGTQLSDVGLVHLAGLTQLEILDLDDTSITDAGLVHLGGLTQLRMLSLSNSQVSDAGFEHIEQLTNLDSLDLANTQVTDTGLMRLHKLTRLDLLDLSGTRVTDTGLACLKELSTLSFLLIGRTQVSDSGLVHLQGLPRLQVLDLSRTHVTDAGLEHLRTLTRLQKLDLTGTKLTEAGVAELRTALPKVTIVYDSTAEPDQP